MMNHIETVGNIKVYTKASGEEMEVTFINGSDIVLREIYRTKNTKRAIENLFEKLDIYTEEFLYLYANDLEKLTDNTYRAGANDWFCRINNTRFFIHYCKSADEFIRDKNGLRIIDK